MSSCLKSSRTWPTDTHTDRSRYSVCSNSPHIMQCMRCGLIITITRNAWQSPSCSPRGIAVTPLANNWNKTEYWSPPQNLVLIFERSSGRSQIADPRGVYIFAPLKLWSYCTEVYQTFARCSQIIHIEPFNIGIANLSECQGDEWSESADFVHLTLKLIAMATSLER